MGGRATCLHVGTLRLRKRPKGRRVVVQAQCEKCRAYAGDELDSREYTPSELMRFGVALPKRPTRPTTKRRRDYKRELDSNRLKKLKQQCLERDNYTCRSCGEPGNEMAHISYENWGHETLEDVVTNCKKCNQDERTTRITKRVLG